MYIHVKNRYKKKNIPNFTVPNSHLCARTCDSGSSLTPVLRVPNTRPYIDSCSREIVEYICYWTSQSSKHFDWGKKQGHHTRRESY